LIDGDRVRLGVGEGVGDRLGQRGGSVGLQPMSGAPSGQVEESVGLSVGGSVGASVGSSIGSSVATIVGRTVVTQLGVGFSVGLNVGHKDGPRAGADVGTKGGACLGDTVGLSSVGTKDGVSSHRVAEVSKTIGVAEAQGVMAKQETWHREKMGDTVIGRVEEVESPSTAPPPLAPRDDRRFHSSPAAPRNGASPSLCTGRAKMKVREGRESRDGGSNHLTKQRRGA
jgi:hypothetical protein